MLHRLVIAMSWATVPARVAIPGVSDTRTCLVDSRRISRLGHVPATPHCHTAARTFLSRRRDC